MKRRLLWIGVGAAGAIPFFASAAHGAAPGDETTDPRAGHNAPSGFEAAWGRGPGAAPDEAATVDLSGFSQFRYIMNFRDDPASTPASHDSGFTNGFELARTRLKATGEIHGGDLGFTIEGEFLPAGRDFFFLSGFAEARLDTRNTVLVGQFRLPLWREWSVSESKQLAVNASVMTEGLNPGYTQGVALVHTEDRLRYHASINDGIRAANTPFSSPNEADVAFAGRLDVKGAGGDWSLFDDFTGWRGQPRAWMAGLGVIYHHGGATASSSSPTQQTLLIVAADLSIEGPGWNAYLAGVIAHAGPDSADTRFTDWGAVAHAGYFVTKAVEVFGRWDGIFPDTASGARFQGTENTITAGANWYLFPKSHAAKVTGDVQWLMNPASNNGIVSPLVDASNADIRADSEGDQFTFRFQFQLVF